MQLECNKIIIDDINNNNDIIPIIFIILLYYNYILPYVVIYFKWVLILLALKLLKSFSLASALITASSIEYFNRYSHFSLF